MSTYKETHDSTNTDASLLMQEFPMYGSSRLGVHTVGDSLSRTRYISSTFDAYGFYTSAYENVPIIEADTNTYEYVPLHKQYELSNHLGNVLVTISAKPILVDSSQNGMVDYRKADITSVSDYYPFGSLMPERHWQSTSYRFGFNGKERDKEGMGGGGSTYDYGFRIYNGQIGRFLSVDPIAKNFPFYSPYQFAGNKPIIAIDLDGREELDYRTYQQGMIQGETKLRLVPFPSVAPSIWQDPNVYMDNPYWKPAPQSPNVHPSTLQLQQGMLPSDGINYILNNPTQHTMECGQFSQVLKLYGMLQSMGADEFNNFVTNNGTQPFSIRNQGSPGVVMKNLYMPVNGQWYDNNGVLRKNFNASKFIRNKAEIGSEGVLTTKGLENTVFANENFVKVGKDQFVAQGLGDGSMTFTQMQDALIEIAKANGATISRDDVKLTQIRETGADVKQ